MGRRKNLIALSAELKAYASALCGGVAEADDLVQEAYARALSAPSAPVRLADLRPWMFRVMRNLHIDAVRRSKVRMEYVADQKRFLSEAGDGAPDVVRDLMVRQAFAALKPASREILFLVDIMGMRYGEAAAVLDVPEGTVMSRVSRARRALALEMEQGTVRPLPVRNNKTRA
jgi:RNA polymerase sigma-70 factor (ECF subfamily)